MHKPEAGRSVRLPPSRRHYRGAVTGANESLTYSLMRFRDDCCSLLDGAHRTQPFLGLQRPPALDTRGQACEVETGRSKATVTRAVLNEPIGYAKLQKRQLQPVTGEQLANPRSRAADNGAFLDRHDGAMVRGQRSHKVCIERLDEAHVNERGV